MNAMKKLLPFQMILLAICVSCGGAKQEPETPSAPAAMDERNERPADAGVQVTGLWGKIDDSIVEETFQRHFDDFIECYQSEALDFLEEIEGELSVYLIVSPEGYSTDDIYFEDGNLGSDAAQNCLIGKIKRIRFQKPIGGYNAKVRYSIPFEAPYDHPKPFDWSGDKIEQMVEENREQVDACLAGNTGISLTLYVGRGGKVVAAGGVAGSRDAYEAARCLSRAAKGWTFENPGKRRPAKATVTF